MEDSGAPRLFLPDILVPALDLVFVGINPSVYSAQYGHYFARPSNRFWALLNASGLLPIPVGPDADRRLPEFGVGLTDLVPWATPSAAEVRPEEFAAGRIALHAKLLDAAPRAVCFVGKLAYAEYRGVRKVAFGRQQELIGQSVVFVMPSTSGRANSLHRERVRCLAAVRAYLGQ